MNERIVRARAAARRADPGYLARLERPSVVATAMTASGAAATAGGGAAGAVPGGEVGHREPTARQRSTGVGHDAG